MKVNNNIVISVGQAGNQIAGEFWKALCQEHKIDFQTGKAVDGKPVGAWNSFFSKFGDSAGASYVPRAILTDLEPSVIEDLRKKSGSLFNPRGILHQTESAGGNFATGYTGRGIELCEQVLERLKAEIEACDQVGSVFVIHSLGGGTGSGLGCKLIESIKKQYPQFPILSVAVLPSPRVSSVVTEPYNSVFALSILKQYADACLVFDNEAVYNIAQKRWGIENPKLGTLNQLICEVLTGLTAPMRYSGFLTVEISVRELITNLVPRPGLHFLLAGASPLNPPDQSKFEEPSITQMIEDAFSPDSTFAACSPMEGRFLSTAVLYRGVQDDKQEADAMLSELRHRLPIVTWIPTAFKIGYVEERGLSHRKSVTIIANNTGIAAVFDRIYKQFDKIWARKAFANWYFQSGMTVDDIDRMRAVAGELLDVYRSAEADDEREVPVLRLGAKRPATESAARADEIEESEELSAESKGFSLKDLVNQQRRDLKN